MTYSSTITSKGTLTIPADIRKELGIKPGQIVDIQLDSATKTIKINPTLSIEEVRLRNQKFLNGRVITDDDINRAMGEAALEGNIVE